MVIIYNINYGFNLNLTINIININIIKFIIMIKFIHIQKCMLIIYIYSNNIKFNNWYY